MDKTYTRTGIITNDRAPFRKYNFPITGSATDNICMMIPYNATKADVEEAVAHLTIIANRWVED